MANKKYIDAQGLQTLWGLIKNKIANLADNKSTIYLDEEEHLSIKGYSDASQGQMLVKDTTEGLSWVNPVSTQELQQYVTQAREARDQAGTYSTSAGTSASNAATSAAQAQQINQTTMAWVNSKLWWGTEAEYNALESLTEGTFYFVQL